MLLARFSSKALWNPAREPQRTRRGAVPRTKANLRPISVRSRFPANRLSQLTISSVLITELLLFVPAMVWDSESWLARRSAEASLVAYVLEGPSSGQSFSNGEKSKILAVTGFLSVRTLDAPAGGMATESPDLRKVSDLIDLRRTPLPAAAVRDLQMIFGLGPPVLRVQDRSAVAAWDRVQFEIPQGQLARELRRFAGDFSKISLGIMLVTAVACETFLQFMLMRPLRQIVRSMSSFRDDPRAAVPLNPADVSLSADQAIVAVGAELATLQRSLREALLRNARMADVGLAVLKFCHDMRSALSSCILAADYLTHFSDERVAKQGDKILLGLERATALVSQALEYVRHGSSQRPPSRFKLALLVREVPQLVRFDSGKVFDHNVQSGLEISAVREDLLRVLTNLIRNSVEAGATQVSVTQAIVSGDIALRVSDNGPGLPEDILSNLFRPFAKSAKKGSNGLGLAIARELMVDQGGDLSLLHSSAAGTCFELRFPNDGRSS